MNKFDRVTSILIYLQTRSVVTAAELASRFDVSERTIYRDIRTLENAGVPIGAEAGIGYFLDKAYRLPPVVFTRDEGASLLLVAKIIESQVDSATQDEYLTALDKIRAVMEAEDQQYLSAIDDAIAVYRPGKKEVSSEHNRWLHECRTSLARSQVVEIDYRAGVAATPTRRQVEPIGLYFYGHHWHLIGWCRLRLDYRDFRLDRIQTLELLGEQFRPREHKSLQEYLTREHSGELHEVVLRFSTESARYVGEQRYFFGFVREVETDLGIEMTFVTPNLDYIGRWMLQFTTGVECLSEVMTPTMDRLLGELRDRWTP